MPKISHELRLEIENKIYETFSAADETGANTEYYRNILANKTDDEFYKFISRRLPFRYQLSTWKNSPKMKAVINAFKIIDKPLLEKVNCPNVYVNKDGRPIQTHGDCLVIYLNVPRMKQMLIKKNNTAADISKRDHKTGLLIGDDKGGRTSDREYQSLGAVGNYHTMKELYGFKADGMKRKAEAYSTIIQKGILKEEDIKKDNADSLAKNMLNAYMVGCNIYTNLVFVDYMTPRTLEEQDENRALKRS